MNIGKMFIKKKAAAQAEDNVKLYVHGKVIIVHYKYVWHCQLNY